MVWSNLNMDSFKQGLAKYNKTITELSKTGENNVLLENDFEMISLDDMSSDLVEFKDNKLSTADALFIDDKNMFHIIEFKNINFNNEKDRLLSKFYLNHAIKVIDSCEHNCKLYNHESKFHKYLIDKSKLALRLKPVESLSLLYHYLCKYDDEENSKKTLFNIKKKYWLVSKTGSDLNNPFSKNKQNNRRRNNKQRFSYLIKFKPYFYLDVHAINDKDFEKVLKSWL